MILTEDVTVEIVLKTRVITIKYGPTIKTKKKVKFQVNRLITKWYEQSKPAIVVAHGVTESGAGASRTYRLLDEKTPEWIKEALRARTA